MAVSEAKKASNARWDADNMAYQTVKVRRQLLEDFRAACAARGDKVNTVLREAMEAYIAGGGARIGDSCGSSQDGAQGGEAQGQEVKENGNT